MLKVQGQFSLEVVTDQMIPLKNGQQFRKVVLIGHAPTGWTGDNMPQTMTVAVEPSKKGVEMLGDLSLLPPGSQIIVEEGYIKAGRSKQDPSRVFPTVVATKLHCSAARVQQGQFQQAHPQQVLPVGQPVQAPVSPMNQGLDQIPF